MSCHVEIIYIGNVNHTRPHSPIFSIKFIGISYYISPDNRLIELVRLHGLESDLPEFNMKRKPAKEEYIAIIFKLLAKKFDNDIEEVALYIESENKAPIKKGFGARSAGFGPVPTHPP